MDSIRLGWICSLANTLFLRQYTMSSIGCNSGIHASSRLLACFAFPSSLHTWVFFLGGRMQRRNIERARSLHFTPLQPRPLYLSISPHTISNTSTCTRFVQRISPDRAGAISCFFLLHNQHTPAHQIAMHCTNISITSSLSTILACDFSDSANFNLGCWLSLLGHAD